MSKFVENLKNHSLAQVGKSTFLHFNANKFAPPQASGYGQQDQGPFSKVQICEQSLDVIAGQDIWCCSAFGALPDPLNGFAVTKVVTATVAKCEVS
jgi:hypothetical protein